MRHTPYYIIGIVSLTALLLTVACATPGERRRMAMLLAEADSMNRNYVDFTTDSVMRSVTAFYDRYGTANERLKAHYLLGCAYRDMGEAPQAIAAYQDAIDCADTTAADCDLAVLMAVYGQMSDLFHSQDLPSEELEANKKYSDYALRIHDTLKYIRSVELMMKPYYLLRDTEKVLAVTEKAYQLYLQHGHKKEAASVFNTSIYIYMERGELNKAAQQMKIIEEQADLFDSLGNISKGREWYYFTKGLYYLKVNETDKAEYWLRRLPPERWKEASKGLLAVYRQRGNADSVFKYSQLYEDAVDTLNSRMRTEAVIQTAKLYNYQRFQKQAQEEERRAMRNTIAFWLAFIALIVILAVAVCWIWAYRHNRLRKLRQLQDSIGQTTDALLRTSNELEQLKQDSQSLLAHKEQEISRLRTSLGDQLNRLRAITPVRPTDTELVSLFHKKATDVKGIPFKSDGHRWREMMKMFSESAPQAFAFIAREGVLSPQELQTCILSWLDFTNSEIAVLLDTSQQRVSNIKSSANQKLFGKASAPALRENLLNIPEMGFDV